jgi:integrase
MVEAFSNEEIRAFLAAARAHSERDWAMLLVAYRHALRASEVIAIRPDDVRDGQLKVRRLKGSETTSQPLLEHADPLLNERAAVIEYARKTAPGQRLFKMRRQHVWRLVKRYCGAAGIPWDRAKPHNLKATIITQIVELSGVPKGQAWAGHKSGSSTLRYTRPKSSDVVKAAEGAVGD